MDSMFRESSIKYVDLYSFYTKKVTSMKNLFKGCMKLNMLNLSNFNTSKLKVMSGMFSDCILLTH